MNGKTETAAPLTGLPLILAGVVLALTNFMVVLDTTIANVSVPHISGSLGISGSQGTWIITSYAVAEAVCVPLTGWLAGRFGTVRTFTFGMIGFGVFSVLCGLSTSLGMLVACRIGQGLCGGPLMPLSQTLLMRIFKPEQRAQAMGVWSMTTVVAPILGPILGGTISDSWSWHWIFFINIPVAALCAFGGMRLLSRVETPTSKLRVDRVGLMLMLLWIGALQIMLDLGREHDWFNDRTIVVLGVTALIGFLVFLAWEGTEDQPIVDLRVFRHRGFTVAVLSLALAFGTFFSSAVIIPQWLQTSMGYTATYAGYATAFTGVAAVIMSPIVAKLTNKVDPRALVCFGILWLGFTSLLRVQWNSQADFWSLAFPQMLQGIGMPFFFIPLTTLALGSVQPQETASAAGVMAFLRTMAGAIGTSVSTTAWDDSARVARSEIASRLNSDGTVDAMAAQGFSLDQARLAIAQLVDKEAFALATSHIFLLSAFVFAGAAMIIWLTPRPKRAVGAGAAHQARHQALTPARGCVRDSAMRLLLPVIACLMLVITSLTTVAHATEAPERHLTTIEIEGWHAPGDADEVPADPDKNYPHHHSTCHGHDLAAPVKAPAAPRAHGGTRLSWRMASAELAARIADTPLRPPIA